MPSTKIARRQFLYAAVTSTILSSGRSIEAGASVLSRDGWTVGCFNRPWTQWSFDVALESIKAAGFGVTGLLSRTKGEPFIGSEATPEYLAALKRRIASRGLTANMAALRTKHDIPLEDSIRDTRRQIDHARFLSLKYLLTFGVDQPSQYEHYYRVMTDAAAYSGERGLNLVMKPHGGSTASAAETLRSLEQVKHPNFKIWYDAGNIIHYTGKDPVAELKPIAPHVTGFCAKDCAQVKGDVMIQFGAGKVNFKAVFAVLKEAGFQGPVMIECCAPGETPEAVVAHARANKEFLERVLTS